MKALRALRRHPRLHWSPRHLSITRAAAALLFLGVVVPVLAVAPFVAKARASTILALGLDELTAIADRVVVAEILSVSSRWETGRRRIVSDIEISVAESWKGAMPAAGRMIITQAGGVVGDIEMRVHGLAMFRAGDRAVLFLHGPESGASVVGMGQGMRRLHHDLASARWLVMGGDRSAAVIRRADGVLVTAPAESVEPLTSLRDRVRAMVRR